MNSFQILFFMSMIPLLIVGIYIIARVVTRAVLRTIEEKKQENKNHK